MPRYVITHPEMGIYLGSCLGMGFWTKIDCVGQPAAITFSSQYDAKSFIQEWESPISGCEFQPVSPTDGDFATCDDLERAGLNALMGNMREESKMEDPR